jgi:serine/threonine protein kinase
MPEVMRTVGRYGILRELGRGGMAVVYLARQEDLDRLVALKELAAFHASDPAFARRFIRESRLAGSLVHANVVTVFDYFEHAGTPYIAMEHLERGSLRPYLGHLTLAQIGGALEGLLAGLSAAEQRGIVHRDLKPENLMVASDGRVKIADFGIAKATQASQTGSVLTATGTTIGTPSYMAPEQAMAREVGPWTDLYSVGCTAYEMFTGKPPFHDADTPMAILLRHVTEEIAPAREVADVDPDISAWIERLTAKDPTQRPQSATVAWEELEEILIGKLGPRWRREARLPEPPSLGAAPSAPQRPAESDEFETFAWGGAASVPGPATPPPVEAAPPPEGIDLDGTGPDTPEALPVAEPAGASGFETYVPRAGGPPEPDDSPPPPPDVMPPPQVAPPPPRTVAPRQVAPAPVVARPSLGAAGPPVPRAVGARARAGALALLAALVIPVVASSPDRWNVFAVFSPFEAAGTALATWLVARALSRDRISGSLAAGALVGFGVLTTVASLALLRFSLHRLDAGPTVLAVVVLLGALAILAGGVTCTRSSAGSATIARVDPAALVLGLAGAALACVALFVNYDGYSSLWSEVGEGESAEFFFEPMVAVAAMVVGLVMLGTRPRLAAALLGAVGTATALHFIGVIIAAWRAIGEVGEVRSAGFIGVIGGLLVVAAAASAYRSGNADQVPAPGAGEHY